MFVLPPGPPRVVKKMTAKRLKVQMMPSRMTIVLTDPSPGMVMFQNDCQRFAPSTRAASYWSGMPCRPPSSATIMKGTPAQTFTMMGAM